MKLRSLTMADADKLLELKNYKETRQFAIASHAEIKSEDHYKWLQENLQYFQAIVDGEKMVGAIRIENEVISIWIDRDFWKRGIATYILQHVAKRGQMAFIVCDNIASMRAFIRAGFEPTEYVSEKRKDEWSELTPAYYIFKKY